MTIAIIYQILLLNAWRGNRSLLFNKELLFNRFLMLCIKVFLFSFFFFIQWHSGSSLYEYNAVKVEQK